MLELKTKKELSAFAHTLAGSFQLVRYQSTTYMPVDFETEAYGVVPSADRTVWKPLTRALLQRIGADQFDILFASDSELASFEFMVEQNATRMDEARAAILIRTEHGLRMLNGGGKLEPVTGEFIPNYIKPMLTDNQTARDDVFAIITEWVGGEDEAHSLLYHLATCLAPGYSAVKYVLLLGKGRNGKGVLIKMLEALFGMDNVSHVSRQDMAEKSPVATELNGKLLNLVYDGSSDYIKDSGPEKTLTAGEPLAVRRLYESRSTIVQSNALFVEALNAEPKSKDKSDALQKRLSRFRFDKVFPLNKKFERKMLSEWGLGGFLQLLVEHYIHEDDLAEKLAPTQTSMLLQLEHQAHNSIALQYLKHVELNDTVGAAGLIGTSIPDLVQAFRQWRLKENDLSTWAEPDVLALFNEVVDSDRKTVRTPAGPRKLRVVTAIRKEAQDFLDDMKEIEDAAILESLVDDGPVPDGAADPGLVP